MSSLTPDYRCSSTARRKRTPTRVVREPGKDAATVSAFAEDLAANGGDPGKMARISSGMSAATCQRKLTPTGSASKIMLFEAVGEVT